MHCTVDPLAPTQGASKIPGKRATLSVPRRACHPREQGTRYEKFGPRGGMDGSGI